MEEWFFSFISGVHPLNEMNPEAVRSDAMATKSVSISRSVVTLARSTLVTMLPSPRRATL